VESKCRFVLAIVRLIQRLGLVNVLPSAAVREVSAAERFRLGLGWSRDLLDSDPRLQFLRVAS
jgi:hypothetical protein